MKRFLIIVFAAFFAGLSTACQDSKVVDSDNDGYYYEDEKDCNCNPDMLSEPDSAVVTFRVTINKENPEVKIIVIDGNFSDGKALDTLATSRQRDTLRLLLGTNYTYVAKYKKGSDSIAVPVRAKLYANGNSCNGFYCYEIINNVIDLSLKF